jgi:hypothetical protein
LPVAISGAGRARTAVSMEAQGQPRSWSQSLGIRLVTGGESEAVPETTDAREVRDAVKRVEAGKILEMQKKAGISSSMADDVVIARLMELEGVDVQKKIRREREHGI